jgi:hypothetical protein
MDIDLNSICVPSEDIVAREIEGDLIIVPLVSGIGESDAVLFTLNNTGRAIWSRLDGKRTLKEVVEELAKDFKAPEGKIQDDVLGLVGELVQRKILVCS